MKKTATVEPQPPAAQLDREPHCPACKSTRYVQSDEVLVRLEGLVKVCLDCGCLFLWISDGLRQLLLRRAGHVV